MAIPNDPLDWLNFDITKFEYNVEEKFQDYGFDFEDSFEQVDAGQLQRSPYLIDETDLFRLLRTEKSQRETVAGISPEICDFYDTCVKHFFEDHKKLLSEYLANVGYIQKLDTINKEGKLLKFFDRQNATTINFGDHPCLKETAAECNASMNSKLAKLGLELQKDTQRFREKALQKIEDQLKTCITRYEAFGKEKWIEACKKTSLFNILDQHFAVQLKAMPPAGKNMDDNDDDELRATGNEFDESPSTSENVQPTTEKLSIFLFSAAVYDSKRKIDKDIRHRRAQIAERRSQAALIQAKQGQVNIAASSIKPSDATKMLGDRFRQQDEQLAMQNNRLTALEKSQAKSGNSSAQTSAIPISEPMSVDTNAGKLADDVLTTLQQSHEQLLRKMTLLELQVKNSALAQPAANAAAPASANTAPKNDSRADDQTLNGRARKKAKQAAAIQAAAAQTIAPVNPQPMPPSFTGRNGNGNVKTQQQYQTSTAGSLGSSQDSAARQNGQQPTKTWRRRNQDRQRGGGKAQA